MKKKLLCSVLSSTCIMVLLTGCGYNIVKVEDTKIAEPVAQDIREEEPVSENFEEDTNLEPTEDSIEDGITTDESTETAEVAESESEVIDIYSLDWKQLFCDEISEATYLNKTDKVYYSITDMNDDGIPELSYMSLPGSGSSLTMFLCSDTIYPVMQLIGASSYKDGRIYCMDSSVNSITIYWIYEWNEKTLNYDTIFSGEERVSAGYDENGLGYDVFEYTIDYEECSREVWDDTISALGWGEENDYLLTPIRYENVVSGSEAIEVFKQLIRNY